MPHSGHILLVLCALRSIAALQVNESPLAAGTEMFKKLRTGDKWNLPQGHTVKQRLRSDEGMAYYGTIKIGGQSQQAIYDTGSFEIVLLSQCARGEDVGTEEQPNCCSYSKCPKAVYSSSKSIFWKPKESGFEQITYGSGPVLVKGGFDQVSIGSGDTFEFLKGEIIEADQVPVRVVVDHQIDLFYETKLQAIVGLGPGEFEKQGNRMATHLGIKRFNVCYDEDPNKDGFITWNDKDRSDDPEWVTVPVLGKTFWATPATDFKLVMPDPVKGMAFAKKWEISDIWSDISKQFKDPDEWDKETSIGCDPSCGAVIDTGTSLLTPPPEAVDQIQRAIEAKDIEDCSDLSKFPTLAFKLNGQDLSLPPQSYIGDAGLQDPLEFRNVHLAFPLLPMKSADLHLIQKGDPVHSCVLMLSRGDETEQTPWGSMIIFGMSLFRKYSVQFDLAADFEGKEPSLSNPTRMMRFAEASPDCQETKQGTQFMKLFNGTQNNLHQIHSQRRSFSSIQKVNLKKLRISPLQKQLKELNDKKKETSMLQQKTKVKI